MKRVLVLVTSVLIIAAFAMPGSGVSAIQKGKGGKGKGTETPVIIVFRDAVGDLLGSDGQGAYIHGGLGINRAVLDEAGQVRLSFVQPKGKKTVATRHLKIELDPSARDTAADLPSDGPPPDLGGGLVKLSVRACLHLEPSRASPHAVPLLNTVAP